MDANLILDGAAGLMQLLVAVYALRLNRAFGMARVGWWLFFAFGLLALLHFVQAAVVPVPGAAVGLIVASSFLMVPLLLFIGMIHLEMLLQKRANQEQLESGRRMELELEVRKKDGYLLRALAGLDSEMTERKRMEAKVACLDTIQPRLFDSFAEMIANIPAQSIKRVIAQESFMLGLDLARQRPLLPAEVGSILVFAHFIGAGGKCPHSVLVSIDLPPAHVDFFRRTVVRLIDAGELPNVAREEFEKIFARADANQQASQNFLAPVKAQKHVFDLTHLAHC
jgi:hypothetical protein